MAQIEINCIGQTAIYTNTPEIFSGDVNIDTVKFTFDEVWDGYTEKTAVFYNNPKDTYPVMLDENDVAVIPEAVIADKCKLSIGVFGTNANGDVKTSKILTYNIGKGAISNDLEATTPADFWAQLLARQINYESNLIERQTTFESNITEQQTTFESNITQQQNTFESNMENEFNTLQTNVTNEVDTLEGIVKGRNQARVFNTTADMEAWLKDQKNKGVCNVGDNLYIVALDVPDWWISEVLDTPDANTGYYYKIAKLEVQKVDLTNIESDIDTLQSDVNTLESEVDVIQGKISNLEGTELIASAVEVDDTNLGLGKNNVQDVLEVLKSAVEWKLIESITGNAKINLPSEWNELHVVVEINKDSNNTSSSLLATSTTNLLKKYIDPITKTSYSFYLPIKNMNKDYDFYTQITWTNDNTIRLMNAYYTGKDYTSYSKITVYYR